MQTLKEVNKVIGHWRHRDRQAFTLVEIMIAAAMLALLAVLVLPGFAKVRKRAQGARIINDARVLDTAVNNWVMEHYKVDGDPVDVGSLQSYAKTGVVNPIDILGNPYTIGPVGSNQVLVSVTSKSALDNVGLDWAPY